MIVTRTAYCEKCAKQSRPSSGDVFVLYGSDSESYHIRQCERHVRGKDVGYTPHLFTKLKCANGNVIVQSVCAMDGCGVVVYATEDDGYEFVVQRKSIYEMPIREWNALVLYKDEEYHI